MRNLLFVLIIFLFAPVAGAAQDKPDFSGIWILDPARSDLDTVYGQTRIIKQSATEVDMTLFHSAAGAFHLIPWTFRMNRWAPRRGGEQSREPKVQARWDGDRLILVKSPGESYSALWIWRLAAGGNEMIVESVKWTYIPTVFDFKESSISSAYARDKYVYIKSRALPETNSQLAFQLQSDGTEVAVTCRVEACTFFEIVAGRRSAGRKRSNGDTARVSLSSQVTIEFAK